MDDFWIIATACLATFNCSLLGCYLVLRKKVMVGDAISHAVLPGIVLSFFFVGSLKSAWIFGGAVITGIAATWLMSFWERVGGIRSDAAIGITFTSFFALGVLLISLFTKHVDLDIECILHGEILYVPFRTIQWNQIDLGPYAIYTLGGTLLCNLLFIGLGYRALLTTSFDPLFAQTIGFSTQKWHYGLMSMTAITTLAAFDSVGVILIIALLVTAPAAAYLVTKSLKSMILLSLLFSLIAVLTGHSLAFVLNGSVGGSITLTSVLIFIWALGKYTLQKYISIKK